MRIKQMMKHMCVVGLMMTISVMSLTISSKAATLTEGDYEYEVLDDNTVEIIRYKGTATEVVIPSILGERQVTVIGDKAFMNCDMITKVTIPDGVTKIGENGDGYGVAGAFFECTALKEIVIPSSVKSIVQSAFLRCTSLEQLNLPEGMERIGWGAFEGCSSLNNVVIPASVTSMDYSVFGNCDLDSITVNSDNENYYSVDNCLIDKKKNELILGCYNSKIPDTVTSIGWNAFAGCKRLTSITIPKSVKNMDPQIFDGCSNLKEVVLPDGLATIAGREFAECSSLQKINLPKSLLTIGGYAFTGCKQLKNIAIPESVKDIGEGAFYECTGLERIVIPDSVTSIGVQAFRGCSSLKQAELSDNIKIIPAGMFWNCSSLTEIDIPDGVVSIGDSKWEECAFDGCTGLQKVTIPDSVKYINEDEFMDSETLKIYYGSFKSYAAEWVKENAPYKDAYRTPDPDPQPTPTPDPQPTPTPNPQPTPTPDQKSSETTDTQQDKNQKVPATKGTILTVTKYQCKVRVTSATLPTVEYLATTNKKATTIKVPDSVTVDDITYKVTTVAAKALSGNRKVKKVILGKNVTAIGKNAFAKCKNLKKIEVKSVKWSKKSVGKDAFKGTNKKLVIKVPKKKASVYKKYVRGKGNKTIRVK